MKIKNNQANNIPQTKSTFDPWPLLLINLNNKKINTKGKVATKGPEPKVLANQEYSNWRNSAISNFWITFRYVLQSVPVGAFFSAWEGVQGCYQSMWDHSCFIFHKKISIQDSPTTPTYICRFDILQHKYQSLCIQN